MAEKVTYLFRGSNGKCFPVIFLYDGSFYEGRDIKGRSSNYKAYSEDQLEINKYNILLDNRIRLGKFSRFNVQKKV
jgi:hypothetical protein